MASCGIVSRGRSFVYRFLRLFVPTASSSSAGIAAKNALISSPVFGLSVRPTAVAAVVVAAVEVAAEEVAAVVSGGATYFAAISVRRVLLSEVRMSSYTKLPPSL